MIHSPILSGMSEAAPAVNTGKLNTMVALAVFMVMLFIYLLTVAPTISFWDSSELITCAAIMGIPHPPGSPFLSLLSRVMMIIPFYDFRPLFNPQLDWGSGGGGFESIAYRINLLAVLSGALTVMLTYLITVKLITRITLFRGTVVRVEHVQPQQDGLIMFSALLSSLMAGLSHQFWENSVEIETYMPGLLISMLAVWSTLKWEEKKDDPENVPPNGLNRGFLLLAIYLIGLGMGIHLYVLLITPTIFFIVLAAKPSSPTLLGITDIRLPPNSLYRGLTLALMIIGIILFRHFGGIELFIMIMIFISISGPFLFTRLFPQLDWGSKGISSSTQSGMEKNIVWYALMPVAFCSRLFSIPYHNGQSL